MFRQTIQSCLVLLLVTSALAQSGNDSQFPVHPELLVDELGGCEGITFNGEGRLFVTCRRALWEVGQDYSLRKVSDLESNLGAAGIGDRDLLVADFGPTNAFRDGRNSDGIVYRISPEGEREPHALGIGDPNFILVRADGSYLVSDDATADIYLVSPRGEVELYTTAVNHPNGLVLSADGSTLYVAQIFTNIRPVVMDNAIWAIRLEEGRPARDARLLVRAGPGAAVDGLAMDSLGRIYIAANRAGELWRYDPAIEEMLLIASGMFGLASLAFGEGEFDRGSIYATATFSGGRGGKIWRIPVGIDGAKLNR